MVLAATVAAANPFESVLRAICLEFPELAMTPQMSIAAEESGPSSTWVTFGFGSSIEADGFEFHGARKGLVRDCRRYTELTAWAGRCCGSRGRT